MPAPRPELTFERWIVWSDPYLVAVDKPAGVLSQGGEGGRGRNLVDLARQHFGRGSIGVLHRIDRNVSGLVLLALDPRAARGFSEALARGEVERSYVAVARGSAAEAFVVEAPLLKDGRTNEVRVAEGPGARPARTEVRLLERLRAPMGALAVLAVRPITGRSHQIRVHLAHAGLPIVGDPKYGVAAVGLCRPLLHARRLSFAHPITGERVEIEAKEPWSRGELSTLRARGR